MADPFATVCRTTSLLFLLVLPLMFLGGTARGEPACPDEDCVLDTAREHLSGGRHDEARVFLKGQVKRFPESGAIRVLLAVAYSVEGNHAWAVRTLTKWLADHPGDCEARTWLAWATIQMGETVESLRQLGPEACLGEGPLATRAHLLRGLLLHSAGEGDDARASLEKARGSPIAYKTDREALDGLTRVIDPHRLNDLSWAVEAAVGFTTNALLGAPNDPTDRPGDTESALVQTNAWIRLNPQVGHLLRPSLELQSRALHFFDREARGLSYLNLTGRAGFTLDWGTVRLLAAYRPDYLLLGQGDDFDSGPVWYAGGHRGEVELEVIPWLFAFAGGGYRTFREMGRSRHELDGGLAGQVLLFDRLRVVMALSGRRYWAADAGYHASGLTALVNLSLGLPQGWALQATGSLFSDWYTDSRGFAPFGLEPGQGRTDHFVKASITAWSVVHPGVRVGLAYEYSRRFSTASLFELSDHRVILKFRWSGSMDFHRPDLSSEPSLADIPWGLGQGSHTSGDRIQDLLRQDEQVQNVCGCAQ